MFTRAREKSSQPEDLTAIIAAEERLAVVVTQAEAEAAALVARTEESLQRLEQNETADLQQAFASVEAQERAFREAELSSLEAATSQRLERFRTLPDQRIAQLADLVLERLTTASDTGAA